MRRSEFGCTALGCAFPGYANFTRLENGDVRVTVRSAPTQGDAGVQAGPTASFDVPEAVWEELHFTGAPA